MHIKVSPYILEDIPGNIWNCYSDSPLHLSELGERPEQALSLAYPNKKEAHDMRCEEQAL